MHDSNSHEWESHYRQMISQSRRRLEQMLDRFGESLYDWLNAALNWPEEDWQADLANFVAHSRRTGIELSEESLEQIRGLVEARVRGTGVFAEHAHGGSQRSKPTIQLAAITIAPDSDTDATVDLGEGPQEEVAGPGPETSDAFKNKVRTILELTDKFVADIWKQNQGTIRVEDRNFLQFDHYFKQSRMPLILVISPHFTAKGAALAINTAAYSFGKTPIGSIALRKKLKPGETLAERYRAIQSEAFKQAAAEAAFLAELYYGAIASLTSAGDLIVTIDDISRNGLRWDHLLFALPMMAVFRRGMKRLLIKLPGGKVLEIPGQLLEKLSSLSTSRRNKLIARAKAAKTKEESLDILKREIAASLRGGQVHHLISGEVHKAIQNHPILKGKYKYRDTRLEVIAISEEAHRGWAEWHRKLDTEVAAWIARNRSADEAVFEAFLRKRYSEPDVKWRFAIGPQ